MFCPICGTEISESYRFCPNCGTVIHEIKSEAQTDQQFDAQTEPQTEPGFEIEIEPDSDLQFDIEIEPQSEPGSDQQFDIDIEPKSEAAPQPEPKPQSEVEPQPEPQPEPQAGPQASPFYQQGPQNAPPYNYARPQYRFYDCGVYARDIAVSVILSIVTCGIYSIYWFIKLVDEVNRVANDQNAFSGGVTWLLSFLTGGIYGCYWYYQAGKKLRYAKQVRLMPCSDNLEVLYLVLAIFRYDIVNKCLIQSELNKMATPGK